MEKDAIQDFFETLDTQGEPEVNFDEMFAKEQKVTEPSQEGEDNSPMTEETSEELPFNKNPKIKRYIERQTKKMLEQELEKLGTRETVTESKPQTKEIPAEWLMAYGDSDQSVQAWKIQQDLIAQAVERAKAEALNEFQSSIEQEKQAEKQFEEFISESLEDLEDTHGIDLTSDSPAGRRNRAEFLELVRRVSPKDTEGNVVSYADFNEVYSLYETTRRRDDDVTAQKKSVAGRTMSKSNETRIMDPNAPKTNVTFGGIVDSLFNK